MITSFDELMKYAAAMPEKRVVVVNPKNEETFSAVSDALRMLKTRFVLPGDKAIIAQALKTYGIPESSVEVIDAPDVHPILMEVVLRNGQAPPQHLLDQQVDAVVGVGRDEAEQ